MVILNFGHPLTEVQQARLEELAGRPAERVIEVKFQVEQGAQLRPQIVDLVNQAGLSSVEWQTIPFVVNLPGYAPAAACLLAEIEGRSGHLPPIIKTRPVTGSLLTEYEVAEIVNLHDVRAEARTRR
jgi:hypothetical protein